jgi:hypothetical protein
MEELLKLHSQIQYLLDKTIMDIGLTYSHYTLNRNESLIKDINEKVEKAEKLRNKLKIIEHKISCFDDRDI